MPIYDYHCPSCGHRAEILHGVHDDSPRSCSNCGTTMRKAFAPPAIVFKGTGWAKVERRSSGAAKRSEGDGGAGSGDVAGSGTSEGGPSKAGSGGDSAAASAKASDSAS